MNVKGVIFDLGNVLVEYNLSLIFNRFIAVSDINAKKEEIYKFFTLAYSRRFEIGAINRYEFYKEVSSHFELKISYEDFRQVYCDIFHERLDFKPYVLEIIEKYPVAILSNTDELHHEYLINKFPWLSKIDKWFVSYKMRKLKPDPSIYLDVIKDFNGAKPKELIFIDDKKENIKGAKQVGLKSILFSSTSDVVRKLKKIKVIG
jgi:putative hydrolase of the HAD superfamily